MSFKFYLTLVIIAIFLTFQANNVKADASNSIKHDTTNVKERAENDSIVQVEPKVDLHDIQKRVVYPEEAKKNGIEGKVVVMVLIGKDGSPIKYKISSSDSEMLNDSAAKAIMETKFTPATENGKPINVWVSIPITYRLKK